MVNSQSFLVVILTLLMATVINPCSSSFAEESSQTRVDEEDVVDASPKRGWGEFTLVDEPAERPWWQKTLLWIPNRVADLIDVFRVDVGVGPSVGGVVRITEYAQAGYRQMMPGSLRIGDFGRDYPVMVERSNEFGIGPTFAGSRDREVCPGEVGVGLDLFIAGAYGGVCFDELADFFAGLFFADLKDDDWE